MSALSIFAESVALFKQKEAAEKEQFINEYNRSIKKILRLIAEQKAGNKSPKLSKKIKKAVDKHNHHMSAFGWPYTPPCQREFKL